MKIVSWNINGLRSLSTSVDSVLGQLEGDIVCFQETKLCRHSLDSAVIFADGYCSFLSFCKTRRSGYSGVATFCRNRCAPFNAEEGVTSACLTSDLDGSSIGEYANLEDLATDLKLLDGEGRTVITRHKFRHLQNNRDVYVCVINVYCPRFDPDRPERWCFKMDFYRALEARAKKLLEAGNFVVIVGDLNVAMSLQDHCDPDEDPEFDCREHREWLRSLVLLEDNVESRFVDLFRYFNPDAKEAYTCWNTRISARQTNFGTRIDYVIVDRQLLKLGFFSGCFHLPEVLVSDHCPVVALVDNKLFTPVPAEILPKLCSKFLPEFKGTQQKLAGFLVQTQQGPNFEAPMAKVRKVVPRQQKMDQFFKCSVSTDKKTEIESSENSSGFCSNDSSQCNSKTSQNSENSVSSDICVEVYNLSHSERNSAALGHDAFQNWSHIFKSTPVTPMCTLHKEPCILRTVKKSGPNKNRQFWVCARPEGQKGHVKSRCDHFQWAKRS